jgi:hypothetical protein
MYMNQFDSLLWNKLCQISLTYSLKIINLISCAFFLRAYCILFTIKRIFFFLFGQSSSNFLNKSLFRLSFLYISTSLSYVKLREIMKTIFIRVFQLILSFAIKIVTINIMLKTVNKMFIKIDPKLC